MSQVGISLILVAVTMSLSSRTLDGTVVLWTKRVITAILSLEPQFTCWPDEEERQDIKRRIQRFSGFPSCLGFLDGTLIPLAEKPVRDGEDYYSRKGRYGIAAMIVCDDKKRVRYVLAGNPGCSHDARTFSFSLLAEDPQRLFATDEYLLADSAYTPSSTIIPAFKRPPGAGLSEMQARFNYRLSNARVRVEHCIGLLKARFQSLRELRVRIRDAEGVKLCVDWIRCCCVLHNMLLDDEADSEWFDGDSMDTEEDVASTGQLESDDREQSSRERERGLQKRERLLHIVLSHFDDVSL